MLLIYMIDSPNFFFAFYDYYVMFGWLIFYIMLECETKFEYLLLFVCLFFFFFFFCYIMFFLFNDLY